MRLSDADREQLLETLKVHAAAGELDVAELERRVEVVVKADTREQALVVLADLSPSARGLPGSGASPGAGALPVRARGRRGHGHADAPAVDWRPTAERFRDPRTNRVMRVWEDAAGGRHYVVDDRQ